MKNRKHCSWNDCSASCIDDNDSKSVVNIQDLLNMLGIWGRLSYVISQQPTTPTAPLYPRVFFLSQAIIHTGELCRVAYLRPLLLSNDRIAFNEFNSSCPRPQCGRGHTDCEARTVAISRKNRHCISACGIDSLVASGQFNILANFDGAYFVGKECRRDMAEILASHDRNIHRFRSCHHVGGDLSADTWRIAVHIRPDLCHLYLLVSDQCN